MNSAAVGVTTNSVRRSLEISTAPVVPLRTKAKSTKGAVPTAQLVTR